MTVFLLVVLLLSVNFTFEYCWLPTNRFKRHRSFSLMVTLFPGFGLNGTSALDGIKGLIVDRLLMVEVKQAAGSSGITIHI